MTTFTYQGTILRWVDGDTVDLHLTREFDMGFYVTLTGTYQSRFRLAGIDTPERGQPGYAEARTLAESLCPIGSTVTVTTYKADKYGRFLADITTPTGGDVADIIIDAGLGRPYFGGTKEG